MDASKGTVATRGRRQERVGVVVSAKMQKSVVVAVERLVRHGLYRKTLRLTSRFMAHDEKGAQRGDRVRIRETRPMSKRKRWEVVEILGRVAMPAVEETAGAQA
jgi:small subunit ribosomal protein S17